MRVRPVQTAFTSGELDPAVLARVDLPRYQAGAERIQNMIVLPQGGVKRRPGFQRVAAGHASVSGFRRLLLTFEFSDDQAYILEWGPVVVRFHTAAGPVMDGVAPYFVTIPPGLAEVGITQPPQFAQFEDALYIASGFRPYKLVRLGHTNWVFQQVNFVWGPFEEVNDSATTVTASAASGSITLSASSPIFTFTDIGASFYISDGTTDGYVKITGYTSDSTVSALVVETVPTGPQTAWAHSAWSDSRGYPDAVTFHQQRLWWGGQSQGGAQRSGAQRAWGSVLGDFENHAAGVDDDAAITVQAAGRTANPILWMVSERRGIILGTSADTFLISGGDSGGGGIVAPLTPLSTMVGRQTADTCGKITPALVGSRTMFVSRTRRQVRALEFKFDEDSFAAPEVSILARHAVAPGVRELRWAQEPFGVLWAVLDDGTLAALTFEPDEGLVAWHRHKIEGSEIISAATLPVEDGAQLWVLVKRMIQGEALPQLSVERMALPGYSDSWAAYSGAPANVITGLEYLNGHEVTVLADGAEHPNRTVVSGEITLEAPASIVIVGLPMKYRLRPVRLDKVDLPLQSSLGMPRSWVELFLRLVESHVPNVNGEQPLVRSPEDQMNLTPPLVTGDADLRMVGWDTKGAIDIEGAVPFPLHITAIFGTQEIGGS